ncbi:putative PPC domain-containing protein [Medicago truncatula]|uniref:Putative PPC domain-containing protein n=1 Tax=Medicago truncatula TaxID=3880 RepID=A0A396JSN4_MEDTR|nr:putative PPC domain-containing protein [Medicago truncatula]
MYVLISSRHDHIFMIFFIESCVNNHKNHDEEEEEDNEKRDEPREDATEIGNRRPRGRPPGSKNIAQFARRRQSNVTLRQPSALGAVVALHRIEILSLTRKFLLGHASIGLIVYLDGGQGHVVKGFVVGTLVVVGLFMLIAATFTNATYQRLRLDNNDNDNNEKPSSVALCIVEERLVDRLRR